MGHAQNLPAEEVLRARQRSVEHVLFPFLTDRDPAEAAALARRFAGTGTAFVPTLVTFTRCALVPTNSLAALLADTAGRHEPRRPYMAGFLVDDWKEQLEERIAQEAVGDTLPWAMLHARQIDDLRLLHEAGVPILAGTDVAVLGVFPGSTLHNELELLVELVGLSPGEAIEGATRRSAELLGLADELGTIEPGKVADLVLLDADPLADIRNTRRMAALVRDGVHYDRGDLERLRRRVAHDAEALRSAANRVPNGRYALEAVASGRVFSAELELLAVESRPWGRLTVGAVGVVTAVRGIATDGGTWTFAAGGPVRRVRLTFADEVSGALELGTDPPPIWSQERKASCGIAGSGIQRLSRSISRRLDATDGCSLVPQRLRRIDPRSACGGYPARHHGDESE